MIVLVLQRHYRTYSIGSMGVKVTHPRRAFRSSESPRGWGLTDLVRCKVVCWCVDVVCGRGMSSMAGLGRLVELVPMPELLLVCMGLH